MRKQYYKRVDYPETPCPICGKMFKPKRSNQRTCGAIKCKNRMQAEFRKEWEKSHRESINERKRRYRAEEAAAEAVLVEEPKPKHKSNIVAIGYAERQIAKSLELAGKVRTEL